MHDDWWQQAADLLRLSSWFLQKRAVRGSAERGAGRLPQFKENHGDAFQKDRIIPKSGHSKLYTEGEKYRLESLSISFCLAGRLAASAVQPCKYWRLRGWEEHQI